jgi:hypothetical protein
MNPAYELGDTLRRAVRDLASEVLDLTSKAERLCRPSPWPLGDAAEPAD